MRWFPGNQQPEAWAIRELDWRLKRLERQRADYMQTLSTVVPTVHHWTPTTPGFTPGTWDANGAPAGASVTFEVPSDEAWGYFAWGFDFQVKTGGIFSPTWRAKMDGAILDGGARIGSYAASGSPTVPDWTHPNARLTYDPIDVGAFELRPEPLAMGSHTFLMDFATTGSAYAFEFAIRNQWVRGYVQA